MNHLDCVIAGCCWHTRNCCIHRHGTMQPGMEKRIDPVIAWHNLGRPRNWSQLGLVSDSWTGLRCVLCGCSADLVSCPWAPLLQQHLASALPPTIWYILLTTNKLQRYDFLFVSNLQYVRCSKHRNHCQSGVHLSFHLQADWICFLTHRLTSVLLSAVLYFAGLCRSTFWIFPTGSMCPLWIDPTTLTHWIGYQSLWY